MKSLIIAENDSTINTFDAFLKKNGFDTIIYRWLLKALDNIEEISPHVIILSAEDYPRHWKTLVQYTHSEACKLDPIILLVANNLSEKEIEKAGVLGVHGVITSFNTPSEEEKIFNLLDSLLGPLNITGLKVNQDFDDIFDVSEKENEINIEQNVTVGEQNIVPETSVEKEIVKEDFLIDFSFNHPRTKVLITGKVLRFDYPVIHFKPTNEEDLRAVRFGQKLENCTLKEEEKITSTNVQVQGIDNGIIEFCLIK
jgi:hypothetical protein